MSYSQQGSPGYEYIDELTGRRVIVQPNFTTTANVAPQPEANHAPCPDCREAARHAYSDATTPGFFRPYCSKHDPEKAHQSEASKGEAVQASPYLGFSGHVQSIPEMTDQRPVASAGGEIPQDLRALYSACSEKRFAHEVTIRDLIERIADLEAQLAGKWISVKERLPEVNDEVWTWTVFHDGAQEYGDTSWLQDDGTWAMGSAKNFTVTHWQPLPAPPTEEDL